MTENQTLTQSLFMKTETRSMFVMEWPQEILQNHMMIHVTDE